MKKNPYKGIFDDIGRGIEPLTLYMNKFRELEDERKRKLATYFGVFRTGKQLELMTKLNDAFEDHMNRRWGKKEIEMLRNKNK